MIYFLLPKTYIHTYKNIALEQNSEIPQAAISSSLYHYLSDIKEKINIYESEWDIYKKYTNPFEYIHTMVPNKKKSISKIKPLSRSYFKLIEIVQTFNLIDLDAPFINTFHLAEGPGGFIEATKDLRKQPNDTYIGMTILHDSHDSNVPGWRKSQQFLRDNLNVIIENGADNTGNILNFDNFVYCKEKYASSMDFITGDGGFDFSEDFNKQEINVARLLFGQIAFALCMQKQGGSFVLKIFDSFMLYTVDLLYILSSFYEKVYITKPHTIRYANSEKYIVCKNFLFSSCEPFYPFLHKAFLGITKVKEDSMTLYIQRFLNIPISNYFLTKMEEYNSIFGQQQIENIYYTISLIETKNKNEKIDNLLRNNIHKCVSWCIKMGIPYNQIANTNIFLFHKNGDFPIGELKNYDGTNEGKDNAVYEW